ncbi:MAG: ABC transporter substrate-binding protein [Christensenellales bacterium]
MNTRKNKWVALIIAVALLSMIVGGCANTNNTQPTQTPGANVDELIKVKFILDYVPNTNHIGAYVAQALGYYEEEGLDVEIIQPTEGATATLIAAGKGEFGVSYQEDVTYARTAKDPLPVKAIAAILQHNTSGFVSVKEKNILSPADFENKAYTGWDSPAEAAIIKAVMARAGADPSKISIIQSTGADSISVIQSQVDLTWIYYGWTGIELEIAGVEVNYLPLTDLHPALDFYTPVIIASESYLAQNPEIAQKFLRATSKGYEYCVKNPQKATELFVAAVPDYSAEMIQRSVDYLNQYFIADAPRWGEMKAERWDAYTQFMIESNLITKDMPANEAFTNEFLPDVS